MIIIDKERPIKLCHCSPGDTVRLLDVDDTFMVCVYSDQPSPPRTMNGLYSDDRPMFLVSLYSGHVRPMPHLSSLIRRVKAYVTVGQNPPLSA